VQELICEDPSEYRAMFRMEKDSFDYLLNLVRPHIEKEDTIFRESVPARERLEVTLHFLATGNYSFKKNLSVITCYK
jgi:hypothetical protein